MEAVDKHQPKLPIEIIEELWSTIGLHSSDQRLHKLASAMFEMQMLKIINEMKHVQAGSKPLSDTRAVKQTFRFEDLQKSMSEFGVCIRRPPFIAEKTV